MSVAVGAVDRVFPLLHIAWHEYPLRSSVRTPLRQTPVAGARRYRKKLRELRWRDAIAAGGIGRDEPTVLNVPDREPAHRSALAASDTVADRPRLDAVAVGTHLEERFEQHVGVLTLAEFVLREPPEVAHAYVPGVVDG